MRRDRTTRTTDRGRPRIWHHDYLHLRPLAEDLGKMIGAPPEGAPARSVLDLGCGDSPYRSLFGDAADRYVRVDLDVSTRPTVVARAEGLPFADAVFDAVLSTQLLGLVDDPAAMAGEIARVVRPGGRVWVSGPAAFPFDSDRAEHRFGEPELRGLFAGLELCEIRRQGGLLALPFAIANRAAREALRAAERRAGPPARVLRPATSLMFTACNLAGRALERLAASGPLAPFLGYLDRLMPMNYLVAARRPSGS